MTDDLFYHKELLESLKSNFVEDAIWLPLYLYKSEEFDDSTNCWSRVFGYLVKDDIVLKCLSSHQQDQAPDVRNVIDNDYSYSAFYRAGIEPLTIERNFLIEDKNYQYIDVSEELVLYFKLYEELTDKQNRTYSFLKHGEKEIVIKIESNRVHIKLKYLIEYMAIRKMHYIICFNFGAQTSINNPYNINFKPTVRNGIVTRTDEINMNHDVQFHFGRLCSIISGKKLIRYKDIKIVGSHYESNKQFESFIVSFDENGKEKELSCNSDKSIPVFFSKKVLNKYFEDHRFTIDENKLSFGCHYSIEMDNHNSDYIIVLLYKLSFLPYEEQKHWRSHNLPPSTKYTYSKSFQNSLSGVWKIYNETADFILKEKYEEFNKQWFTKNNWYLFKPLRKNQENYFRSLHLPTSNELVEFGEQIKVLALLFVDSINMKELKLKTGSAEKYSINLFDIYLQSHSFVNSEIIIYLRNLQTLRSGMTNAHRSSPNNKELIKARLYFVINEDNSNLKTVAITIFEKAISMIDFLQSNFLLNQ